MAKPFEGILARHRVAATREGGYEVVMVDDLPGGDLGLLIAALEGRGGLLVTTPTVAERYGRPLRESLRERGVDVPMMVLPVVETTKSLAMVERVCHAAYAHGLGRKSVLVALSGGVCSDVVTTAASLIRRGIATIRVPTTLIGQVDAVVGIKGGVNFMGRKSALGCFYPAERVFVDPVFLESLPTVHLRTGFAEIAKIAMIRDAELFDLLEAHAADLIASAFRAPIVRKREILWRAITGMCAELEPNLYETRYRRMVDFGHTFSNQLEPAADYRIRHGEAVAVDMAFCAAISAEMGLIERGMRDRIWALLAEMGLPLHVAELTLDLIDTSLVRAETHRAGSVNLIVPDGIGSTRVIADRAVLERDLLAAALAALKREVSPRIACGDAPAAALVFDVGGTTTRAAAFDPATRTLSAEVRRETPSFLNLPDSRPEAICDALVSLLVDLARSLLPDRLPDRIGLAFPGPIDAAGRAVTAPTVWGKHEGAPLDPRGLLQARFPGCRIRILNDVTAAGYRYLDDRDLCIVTVSSGIGTKIFIDGVPRVGSAGRGGEIGHVCVDHREDAAVCDCGGRGHLGAVASGRACERRTRLNAVRDPTGFRGSALFEICCGDAARIDNRAIAEAFSAGDPWTGRAVASVAEPLGRMLGSIHLSAGIERFVIIGGFACAMGERYRHLLARHAAAVTWHTGQDWDAMIELGLDDDRNGLIGAGMALNTPRGAMT